MLAVQSWPMACERVSSSQKQKEGQLSGVEGMQQQQPTARWGDSSHRGWSDALSTIVYGECLLAKTSICPPAQCPDIHILDPFSHPPLQHFFIPSSVWVWCFSWYCGSASHVALARSCSPSSGPGTQSGSSGWWCFKISHRGQYNDISNFTLSLCRENDK